MKTKTKSNDKTSVSEVIYQQNANTDGAMKSTVPRVFKNKH